MNRREEELERFDPNWDYREDTGIDFDRLDEEWNGQSTRFMDYAVLSAQANKAHREAWERVKTRRSVLIKQIREDDPKVKNDYVEAYYRTDEEYIQLRQEEIEAEFVKKILEGAVFAMHQRKAGLESLVDLHGKAYHSDPRSPGERRRQRDAREEETECRIGRSLSRSKSTRRRSGRGR